jgi:hypothetical protein
MWLGAFPLIFSRECSDGPARNADLRAVEACVHQSAHRLVGLLV